ncbi:VOC family protein [Streptomyces sp. NPDC102274]|uniref:VOC family protein n=1 Tax=Streptomyces sp. NPDC102274 TaxID=3366151 RepID=UPI0037FC24FE
MSHVTRNQPAGTPTWIDLDVPDVERAKEFYGALFGWEYDAGAPVYTVCRLHGRAVAGFRQVPDAGSHTTAHPGLWCVYFATDDCDATVKRIVDAGGTLTRSPQEIGDQGRLALAADPSGARFGLWQGQALVGCETVNEPGSLVRNDLTSPDPGPAREFYPAVFDFTLDGNDDLPGADFTFLRRPDGHEIGGIMGTPEAPADAWQTLFEVADADAAAERAVAAGGTAGVPSDTIYVRMVKITDPFGNVFEVGARPVQTP